MAVACSCRCCPLHKSRSARVEITLCGGLNPVSHRRTRNIRSSWCGVAPSLSARAVWLAWITLYACRCLRNLVSRRRTRNIRSCWRGSSGCRRRPLSQEPFGSRGYHALRLSLSPRSSSVAVGLETSRSCWRLRLPSPSASQEPFGWRGYHALRLSLSPQILSVAVGLGTSVTLGGSGGCGCRRRPLHKSRSAGADITLYACRCLRDPVSRRRARNIRSSGGCRSRCRPLH